MGHLWQIKQLKNKQMKHLFYSIISLFILLAFACKKDTEIFSFHRPSNPQNFKNVRGGEMYAFAANDSVLVRADYYMKMYGELTTYGSNIIQYGFCWHPNNSKPLIGIDTLMTVVKIPSPMPGTNENFSFSMPITRLTPDTRYFIRSYIIVADGSGNAKDTAYNPVVLETSTKDAIDEWFPLAGAEVPSAGARFDAVAFNLGDTIFFGTGDQGQNILSKDIYMYDPTKGTWDFYVSLQNTQLPVSGQFKSAVTDAIGFAVTLNGPANTKEKFLYVGLGDYGGNDNRDDKSNVLLKYNIGQNTWSETTPSALGVLSGSVCFVINNRAYIGTGSNSAPTGAWVVFDPESDRDGIPSTFGWLQMDGPNINTKRVGAIAFALNGKGYFGLGYDKENDKFLNDFWEFTPDDDDPTNGNWTKKADFPGLARANASAFVIGDQGYVGTGDNVRGDLESDPATFTGVLFEDFYRYDPFNNKWFRQRDYTSNKGDRATISKKVTRGVGFSIQKDKVGFIGYGIVPEVPRAQEDLWLYRPFVSTGK